MITKDQVAAAVALMADTVISRRDLLNQLDGAIGDADFGTSISKGFQAVQAQLPTLAEADIGALLGKVGVTLVSSVGGASGPIFGTAFMKAGQVAKDKHQLSAADLAAMLTAALDGVKARGKAEPGEKTVVDALQPAAEAFAAAVAAGAPLAEAGRRAAAAAQDGVEKTKAMVATKGRAHYVGERGLGHPDAGATAVALLFAALTCE